MRSVLPVGVVACLAAIAVLLAGWLSCAPPVENDQDAAVPLGGPYIVTVDPHQGANNVYLDKVFRVTLSDHIDVKTINQNSISLFSGPIKLWTMAFYDPVRRQLVVWSTRSMRKQAIWVLNIEKGVTGIDDSPVVSGPATSFRTGVQLGQEVPFARPSFSSEIMPVFQKHCSSCHSGQTDEGIASLRLDSVEAIKETALNVKAGGWPGWNRITPEHPGESYLLYKVSGDERIAGTRMPLAQNMDGPAQSLSQSEMEALSDWIVSGVPFVDPGN